MLLYTVFSNEWCKGWVTYTNSRGHHSGVVIYNIGSYAACVWDNIMYIYRALCLVQYCVCTISVCVQYCVCTISVCVQYCVCTVSHIVCCCAVRSQLSTIVHCFKDTNGVLSWCERVGEGWWCGGIFEGF